MWSGELVASLKRDLWRDTERGKCHGILHDGSMEPIELILHRDVVSSSRRYSWGEGGARGREGDQSSSLPSSFTPPLTSCSSWPRTRLSARPRVPRPIHHPFEKILLRLLASILSFHPSQS